MKILVVSDTHGRNVNLKTVIEKTKSFDLLIHAGDMECREKDIIQLVNCPVEIVAGNNDYYCDSPKEKMFRIGNHNIFLTHGHNYIVAAGTKYIKEEALKRGANLVIYGHTHIPLIEKYPNITVINPGSLTMPRQSGGIPSYIVIDIDNKDEFHYTIKYLEKNEKK